ncbi:MAG TPA: hypothetical protein VK179_17470 [Bacteroidales bacterium]|nr:hypothetical protein [Bacteroidales bacterium]
MKPVLFILSLASLIACSTQPKPMTDTQLKAVIEEGQPVIKAYMDALKTFDVPELIALSDTADSNFMMVVVGNVIRTKDITGTVGSLSGQSFVTKEEKYLVLSPAEFIYYWHGANDVYLKTGDTIKVPEYFSSWFFHKVNGEWKILYGHESQPLPTSALAAADSTAK